MVSDIPDRIVLTGVLSVAFPALAAEIREGRGLKQPYLRALGLITVVYWPALILLALLAHPVVFLILGRQWVEAVPLLQLMAIAGLAWFPVTLTSPVLLAMGANRDRVMADLIGRSVSALVLCSAAWFGIMAMAASKLVTLPFQMVALASVRAAARRLQRPRALRRPLEERSRYGQQRGRAGVRRGALGLELRAVARSRTRGSAVGGSRLVARCAHDATPRAARTEAGRRTFRGDIVRATPARPCRLARLKGRQPIGRVRSRKPALVQAAELPLADPVVPGIT